ncbi:MAG: hypothetical protein KatS3mg124_0160 [Porticoccaceae bacterium]|nr:MAG: hypothetical protein KatS3mg124_0160 [Porticoccaceae bacterium]
MERRFSRDELIDHAMLYWAADCFHTSARFYWEAYHRPWRPDRPGLPVVPVPTAIAILPGEITYPPRAWAERYYHLVRWSELPAGGHFAVAEEPERMAADLRAFFRPLRREAGGG